MGPYPGGQAEYLRVPYADFNCLPLPAGTEHEADYALLADIFPTGYHGCELAGVAPGETVAVYGAGLVGLMAAYSAFLRGASRVFVVDRVPERLAMDERDRRRSRSTSPGVTRCSGSRTRLAARAPTKVWTPSATRPRPGPVTARSLLLVLNQLIQTVRPTGALGVPGLYVPSDPGGIDEHARQGLLLMAIGQLFEKGLRAGTGQANVKRYNRQLRDLIIDGRATPSFVVSHELRSTMRRAPTRSSTSGSRATPKSFSSPEPDPPMQPDDRADREATHKP